MQLEDYIVSTGISNRLSKEDGKLYFHMFAIGKNNKKLFFCGDYWDEDICKRVESTDFIFVFQELVKNFENEETRDALLASFLF